MNEQHFFMRFLLHGSSKVAETVTALQFCGIHRLVCMLHQAFHVGSILGIGDNADTGGNIMIDLTVTKIKRFVQFLNNLSGKRFSLQMILCRIRYYNCKFVSTQTRDRIKLVDT